MSKTAKPKYQDIPRFDLINKYENEMKSMYNKVLVDTVKMIGTKMLGMNPTSN